MNIRRKTSPPTGWHFPAADGVILRAPTYELLEKAVFEWRLQNSIPPGDIRADIDRYFCTRWPENCQLEAKDTELPPGVTADEDRLADRVLRWVAGMIDPRRMPQGGWPLAPLKTAAEREAACSACHRNTSWESNCGGCDRSVQAASSRIRNNRPNAHPHSVRACSLFGWDNASACHLKEDALGVTADDVKREMAPAACWMRNKAG